MRAHAASATTVGQLTEVIVEYGDLDLPPPTDAHVGDPVVDDELPQRRPRHPNVFRGLLARQPDGWPNQERRNDPTTVKEHRWW